ncbi:hypothetical protein M0R72_10395 [Candidatus Pacearchaeota archaeon]|nr:hypothetical protein [Candidatus Pacearchaeota archaeon]
MGRTKDTIRGLVCAAMGVEDRGAVHPDKKRHKDWAKKSKAWLKKHNRCELCDSKLGAEDTELEVHHAFPYHLYPEKEMDEQHWHALCRKPHDCHRLFGHLGDFSLFNPVLSEFISVHQKLKRLAKTMLSKARIDK